MANVFLPFESYILNSSGPSTDPCTVPIQNLKDVLVPWWDVFLYFFMKQLGDQENMHNFGQNWLSFFN